MRSTEHDDEMEHTIKKGRLHRMSARIRIMHLCILRAYLRLLLRLKSKDITY